MQQFATRLASKGSDGVTTRNTLRAGGMALPGEDKLFPSQTIAGPNMPMPAPLGEAKVGLTADDPRKKQALLQRAGQSETILGTKLG